MNKLPSILSFIVAACGVLVAAGWLLGVPVLQSFIPGGITMKFTSAVCFILSGILLYYINVAVSGRTETAQVILPLASMLIMMFMVTILSSVLLRTHTGIEDLFVKEVEGALGTAVPGRPPIVAMINFILVSVAGLCAMYSPEDARPKAFLAGVVVLLIGMVAAIGHLTSTPLFYYDIPGINTAMPLHGAALFILLGVGLISIGGKK